MANLNINVELKISFLSEDFEEDENYEKYNLYLNGVLFDWCKIHIKDRRTKVGCGFDYRTKAVLGMTDDLEIIEKYLEEEKLCQI